MSQEELINSGSSSEISALNAQIDALNQKIKKIYQEKTDLEILLETATVHSDVMLEEIQQEKVDLEILLETTTEHSDVIGLELQSQAEEARRQTEEQFRLIAEATPVTILITRMADGKILYANETAGVMLGATPETLLERYSLDLYCEPSDRQMVVSALQTKNAFQGELRLKRLDGTPFWALSSFRQFLFKGEPTILTALYNITDRKQAEDALRLAEENYRSIFENALEGIFQTSPDGRYISINPAMARILGYESPEEVMKNAPNVANDYVDQGDRDEFRRLIESQGSVKRFEHQLYRRDGSIIWISESARSVRDADGVLLYYEGIVEDITQRKQEEEALRRQVQQLQIEIDETKRARQVAEITQTDYFQQILEEADSLRYSDEW
jgi:PAS domain S-box-containing protein